MQDIDVSPRNMLFPMPRLCRQMRLVRGIAIRDVCTSNRQKPLVVLGTLSDQQNNVFWRSTIIIHPT
jgi:hypothetical protein